VPDNQLLPKTRYARSDDVLIAHQVTGDGPVDVVMAPGTMSRLDLDWEIPRRALFFQRFSRFCRLIRFDKRVRLRRQVRCGGVGSGLGGHAVDFAFRPGAGGGI
jgi:hypothetical protein